MTRAEFDVFCETHRQEWLRYAKTLLRGAGDAEDAVHAAIRDVLGKEVYLRDNNIRRRIYWRLADIRRSVRNFHGTVSLGSPEAAEAVMLPQAPDSSQAFHDLLSDFRTVLDGSPFSPLEREVVVARLIHSQPWAAISRAYPQRTMDGWKMFFYRVALPYFQQKLDTYRPLGA